MNERLIAQFFAPKDTIATCRFETEGEISRLPVLSEQLGLPRGSVGW
jgi:hypothetical protein